MNNDGWTPAGCSCCSSCPGSARCARSPRARRTPPRRSRSRSPRWPRGGHAAVEPEGRRVRLTPAGRRLADHAVTILAAVEAARLDLDPAPSRPGTVRVAGFATAIRRSLLPVARASSPTDASRRASCRSTSTSRPRRSTLLAADDVDLALDLRLQPRAGDVRPRRSSATPLWTARWGLGVPARRRPGGAGDARRRLRRYARRRLDRELPQHRRRERRPHARRRWPASRRGSRTASTASSSSRT